MEFSITMNNAEFIISSVVGPIVGAVYFTIKHYLSKNKAENIEVLTNEK